MSMKKVSMTAVALLLSNAALADVVTYATNTHITSSTNWDDFLNFTQFDPSLGTLTSIKITLFGDVLGNAQAESLDSDATELTLSLLSDITLKRPDGSIILVTSPEVDGLFAASAYDGTTDFGGTSGVTFTDLTGALSKFTILTSASDFSLFTGVGVVAAPTDAAGSSLATGAGNLIASFEAQAGAGAQIEYTYASNVPEPASWALMVLGFGFVGFSTRRRRVVVAS